MSGLPLTLIGYRGDYRERRVPRDEIVRARERYERGIARAYSHTPPRDRSARVPDEERAWLAEALRCEDDKKATAPERGEQPGPSAGSVVGSLARNGC